MLYIWLILHVLYLMISKSSVHWRKKELLKRLEICSTAEACGLTLYSLSIVGDVLRGHRFNVGIDTGSLIPRAKGTQLLVDVNGRLAEIPLRRSGPSSFTGTFLAHELGSINMKVRRVVRFQSSHKWRFWHSGTLRRSPREGVQRERSTRAQRGEVQCHWRRAEDGRCRQTGKVRHQCASEHVS